jgi:hypothetical protein
MPSLADQLARFHAETCQRFDALEQKIDAHHREIIVRFDSVDEQLVAIGDLIIDNLGDR